MLLLPKLPLNVGMYQRSVCTVVNGIQLANNINSEVKKEILKVRSDDEYFHPKLVAIAIGHNPASQIYLSKKSEAAKLCGINFEKKSSVYILSIL